MFWGWWVGGPRWGAARVEVWEIAGQSFFFTEFLVLYVKHNVKRFNSLMTYGFLAVRAVLFWTWNCFSARNVKLLVLAILFYFNIC